MPALGAVLVGGTSSRFGSDKSRAEFNGRSLLMHQAETLVGAGVQEVVYVGGEPRSEVPAALRHVPDHREGTAARDRSMLLGIISALAEAGRLGCDKACVLACDVPLVRSGTLRRLLDACSTSDIAVGSCDGDHWSILALRTESFERLLARFTSGVRAVYEAVEELRVARIQLDGLEATNVNDVETLRSISPRFDTRK